METPAGPVTADGGSDLVVPLRALARGDVPRAGGKAANLGEMLRAGLPVPDGFCVTCDAFRAHRDGHGLDRRIEERLVSVDLASPGALEAATAEVRAWIAGAPIPPRVVAAIAAAYGAMGGGAVAVRSSATAEDLLDASFAGQHDTLLDVVGEAAVLEAVRACWASLFTERAVRYRKRHGHDREPIAIACVVQRMIPARAAGVHHPEGCDLPGIGYVAKVTSERGSGFGRLSCEHNRRGPKERCAPDPAAARMTCEVT